LLFVEKLRLYFNLEATKLFIVTSPTKEDGYHPLLDLVLRSRYCIV